MANLSASHVLASHGVEYQGFAARKLRWTALVGTCDATTRVTAAGGLAQSANCRESGR